MSVRLEDVVAHSKAYGFLYPSSEIYGGVQAVYDYGPLGVELKNNLRSLWWDTMLRHYDHIVGLDAAIFMHPKVWEASGHVGQFGDLFIDHKPTQQRHRVDHLIEEHIAKHTLGPAEQQALQELLEGRIRSLYAKVSCVRG